MLTGLGYAGPLVVFGAIMGLPLYYSSLMSLLASLQAEARDVVQTRLDDSPRHHEWIEVAAGQNRVVHAFVAYPETDADTRADLWLLRGR